MSRFLDALHSGRVLLMDGAMGTELIRAGLDTERECAELWNLTHPERVRAVHRAYVFAGAQCLVTNTFQANPDALAKHGLQDRLEEINETAVGLARSTCGVNHFVLASIGPIPLDHPKSFQDHVGRVARSLRMADALLLESWSDASAFGAARLIRESTHELSPHDLPILVSLTYSGGTAPQLLPIYGGSKASALAKLAKKRGAAALGVNCGRDIGLDEILDILRRYRAVTDLPLFARPNAGTPTRTADGWSYPLTPAKLAARLPELLDAGITTCGGCCGTTPEHIAACRPVIDDWNRRHAPREDSP